MHNRTTIWIAKKVVVDDLGSISIVGYGDLKKVENVTVVQASNFKDIQVYGNEINNIKKFKMQETENIDIDGANGIWFEEPLLDEDGYYQEPQYITTPINIRKGYMYFDGKQQVY